MLRRRAVVPPERDGDEKRLQAKSLRATPRLKERLRCITISFDQNQSQSPLTSARLDHI